MSDTPETIWRNGHGFRLRPEIFASRPYIACFRCGTRADGSDATRPCIGHSARLFGSGGTLHLDVSVDPKGRRKPFEQGVELDVDGLGAYLDFLRAFPADRRHADWHWRNADRPQPCETCPGPGGEAARRLAASRASAIDADFHGPTAALPAPKEA